MLQPQAPSLTKIKLKHEHDKNTSSLNKKPSPDQRNQANPWRHHLPMTCLWRHDLFHSSMRCPGGFLSSIWRQAMSLGHNKRPGIWHTSPSTKIKFLYKRKILCRMTLKWWAGEQGGWKQFYWIYKWNYVTKWLCMCTWLEIIWYIITLHLYYIYNIIFLASTVL